MLGQPVDDRRGAEGRRAFLVAGDQKRQSAAMVGNAGRGSGEGGDRALHVIGATTDQATVDDVRHERITAPAVAGRDHVEMAGEPEMRRPATA